MNKHPRHFFLVSALAMALATSSLGVLADTASAEVNNARHETRILTTYELNPYLRAHDLNVTVVDGKATLSGNVAEEVNKALAKEIALGVEGVRSVENNIVVDEDYQPAKPGAERGFGERIDDASITAAVKAKLLWSKNAEGLATEVETRNSRVTLRGTANSAVDSELAERLAENTRNVLSVDNQLKIEPTKNRSEGAAPAKSNDKSSMTEAGESISDAWVTAKVKSTLLYSSNVSGTDIEVSTDKGVVSLKGNVSDGSEHALAIELAKNVRGVTSVQATELTYQ
ncbi:MAG: BON domain-containing protein [Pseudomonadaceae bacterium]|nr:MAG: BON domain-containing protein [Pseudomonadaceae bacterium]